MARRIFVGSRSLVVRCCVFACVFLIVTAPGADSLQFLEQPKRAMSGFLGLNLQINCSTDDPNATLSLLHQKDPFAPPLEKKPSPNKLIESGQVFTILSLTIGDAGINRCKASNSKQTIEWPPMFGMTFLSRAKTPDYFVLMPYKQIVIRPGQEVKVICETEGVSIATLQWKKQIDTVTAAPVAASLVTNTADRSTNRVSATLTITNAQVQDSGTYTCEVTVHSVNDYRSINVDIRAPFKPKILPYTASTTIQEGLPKILSCKATAFPRANITWMKNGQKLNLTDCKVSADSKTCSHEFYEIKEEQLTNPLHSTGLLKIPSAFYPRDQGTFECTARNEYHSTSLVIPLDVQVAPSLEKGPELETIHQLVETESQVACFVEKSNPLPQFQWKYQVMTCTDSPEDCLPDHKKWQTVNPVPSSQVATNKSLVSIAKNDPSAFYLCEATNSLGNDSMLVKFRRMEKLRKYIEVDPNSKKSFTEKFTLQLPCINRCFPLCKNIYFSRNGMMLRPENDTRINVSEVTQDMIRKVVLTITNLTLNDSGTYQCAAAPTLYDRVNITVKALVKPVIESITAHDGVEGSTGHPAQLICQVSHAVPMAEITWLLVEDDGTEKTVTGSNDLGGRIDACTSRASGYFYLRANQPSHLVICNPKYKEHSGQYKCHAANIAGSDSNSTLLNVYAPPTIIDPSDGFNKGVDFGKPVALNCTAKGNPLPNVTWVRNTTDSIEILGDGVGTVQLYISSVGEGHFGKYECVATNRFARAVVSISLLRAGDKIANKGDTRPLSTGAMVGISVGIGVIFIVLLVVFCLYRRQKKQIDEYKELYFLKKTDYEIDPDRSLLEQCNNLPYDPDWEFPEERLILGDVLGSGAFGQVIKAEAIGIVAFNPRDKAPESFKRRSKIRRSTRAKDLAKEHVAGGERSLKTPVAVKTLKEGASEAEYKDLASELKILIHLGQHKNIINLLGACTRGKRLMVIMEFAPHGSLLSFLRARREVYEATWTKTVNNPHQEFTLVDLVMAGYQVSRGMAFLASKKCVHRDMAARNVLVGDDYVMKIADFGLARDIYKDDLYVKKTSGLLPVKWMAPESLFDRVYTEKTDVWSFGILMWEVFTLGGTPYPGLPTEQLLDYLSEGKRMDMPDRCPLEVYTIMRDCWAHDPDERPTFFTLNERLGQILERNLTKDNPYLALQMEEDQEEFGQGYYLQPCESEIRDSKRYVESPVHTPGDDVKDPPKFGADTAKDDDGARYGSPLPPLPPGLPLMSDEDIQNSPLPPIPPAYEDALNDEDAEDDFNPRSPPTTSNKGGRESGIDMDYPADSGEYIDDARPSNPTHDGSKPVAIEMGDMGKLPDTELKTKGGRSGHETEL